VRLPRNLVLRFLMALLGIFIIAELVDDLLGLGWFGHYGKLASSVCALLALILFMITGGGVWGRDE
jgi:hypothetical protein